MPLLPSLQTQAYEFSAPTARGVWRWTTQVDVSGASPSYSIRNVLSPYGLLRDTVPLDGDVVLAMAASINTVSAAFAPDILVGSPSSLTFTVNEGEGVSAPQAGQVVNDGIFGSLLDVTLTPSDDFLAVTPTSRGNLSKDESAPFDVTVDSTELLATSSPYDASITLVDDAAGNSPQTLPITVNVRPKATVGLSDTDVLFTVARPLSGDFPLVGDQTFDVSNDGPGGSQLAYLIQKLLGTSPWLTGIVPSSGSLASGESDTITLSCLPPASMLTGTYTETLRISGYSTNSYLDVTVTLVIS